jgi:hypothetical protein
MSTRIEDQWNKLNALGKRKFVILNSIVIAILFPIIDELINDKTFTLSTQSVAHLLKKMLFWFVISYISFSSTWNTIKKEYIKELKQKSDVEIKFCYYCGSELNGSDICPNCGQKLIL